MKKSKQAGKYILSDFISASVAWLLFNILRYEVFAIDEGADSLLDYLQYPGVLGGQVVIPLFWLVLYYFSGYYNKPPHRTFLDIHYRADRDGFRLFCIAARRYSPFDRYLL